MARKSDVWTKQTCLACLKIYKGALLLKTQREFERENISLGIPLCGCTRSGQNRRPERKQNERHNLCARLSLKTKRNSKKNKLKHRLIVLSDFSVALDRNARKTNLKSKRARHSNSGVQREWRWNTNKPEEYKVKCKLLNENGSSYAIHSLLVAPTCKCSNRIAARP